MSVAETNQATNAVGVLFDGGWTYAVSVYSSMVVKVAVCTIGYGHWLTVGRSSW